VTRVDPQALSIYRVRSILAGPQEILTMTSTLPLPTLFSRALATASKAANLPTIEDETQVHFHLGPHAVSRLYDNTTKELIQSAVTDLKELDRRVAALSLFSSNDVLEDISTRNLVYLFARYVLAEVQNRMKTTDRDERITVLKKTQVNSLFQLINQKGLKL
jgi:immunoglobulin-binding protein 1